ncbi:hypothetical protein HPB47_005471 [Ixodes persulcatus]|uniref:Uncharacterized protein n=1 Tax=Ixodes persulcatus TaxID=34615 RepID=A0AC60PE54_IXOPE|nr:hypothetical protein HPB47_005471 [Ixodes persulcatus]
MPRNKPRRSSGSSSSSGSSRALAHQRQAPAETLFVPPSAFARQLGTEFGHLMPAMEELERRYALIGSRLAQYGSPFDAQCTASRASPCWLQDHQLAWNIAVNCGGIELRCHNPGRLYLSMVPISFHVAPTLRLNESMSTLLAALWLLNNHHCIEYVNVNADITFGILSRPFFSLVNFRAHIRRLQVTAWLPFEEIPNNDELFSLSLSDIRSLESLTLSGMAFTDFATTNITEAMRSNDSVLTYVALCGVHVLRESLEAILSTLSYCRRLKTLDLSFRVGCLGVLKPLEDLLDKNRDLEEFRYELNGPVRFPFRALAKNRTLRSLCVGKEIYDEDDIKDLANSLIRNKRLQSLGIAFCPLENHTELWSIFTDAIAKNVALTELDMQRSELTEPGIRFLAKALEVNETIQKLNVATGKIGASSAKELIERLLTNTSVRELRIGRVTGDMDDLTELFDILQNPRVSNRVIRFYSRTQLPTLIKLMRHKCRQPEVHIAGTEVVPPDLASYFFFSLRLQKHITKLTLGLNAQLTPNCARYLALLFRTSVTLTDVDLYIEIRSPEITILADGIRQSSSILRLRIRAWQFDLQSTDAFVDMLKRNRSINHLTLFRCNEGTDHVIARLGEVLDCNYGLLGVDLFDSQHVRLLCFHFLPQLRRNYFRMSRAAAFLKGTSRDQESADDFRKFALTDALRCRLKNDKDASEEEIIAGISEKLASMKL